MALTLATRCWICCLRILHAAQAVKYGYITVIPIRRQTRPSTPAAWFCSHPRTNRTVCANVISYVPMAILGCPVWRSKVKQNQRSGEAQHAVQTAASYLKYRRLGSIFIDDVCPSTQVWSSSPNSSDGYSASPSHKLLIQKPSHRLLR